MLPRCRNSAIGCICEAGSSGYGKSWAGGCLPREMLAGIGLAGVGHDNPGRISSSHELTGGVPTYLLPGLSSGSIC